jgi:hypothetical protein
MAIRSRLEISSTLILEGLRPKLNRAFSIRKFMACGLRFRVRKGDEETAENLRLGIFSSLILMGLAWNSNSRFAIRIWRIDAGCLKECEGGARRAEMGIAADGGGRVEL